MGIGDHSILAVGQDMLAVSREMVEAMMDDEAELISIYYGEDVAEETAQSLCDGLSEQFPDCDVEVNFGGQPIYYFVVSVE